RCSAEGEQGDATDAHAETAAYQGMGQLVHHDRGEEADGAENAHPDIGRGRQVLVGRRKQPGAERPDDQGDNDEPGEIEADFEAQHPHQGNASSEHGTTSRTEDLQSTTTAGGGRSLGYGGYL